MFVLRSECFVNFLVEYTLLDKVYILYTFFPFFYIKRKVKDLKTAYSLTGKDILIFCYSSLFFPEPINTLK